MFGRSSSLLQSLREQKRFSVYAATGNIPFLTADAILKEPLSTADVITYAEELVEKHASTCGNELWDVYEQLVIAYLTHKPAQTEKAEKIIQVLREKFPKSKVRVRRLEGLLLEAQGKFEAALAVYKEILATEETDLWTRKRVISVALAKGKREDAISLLNAHVDVFMSDVEAWEMLSDLYFQEKQFESAAFCVEEILLLRPQHWGYMIKYADIYAKINTADSLAIARKYYCLALEYEPESVGAMKGIIECNKRARELKQQTQKVNTDIIDQLEILVNTKLALIK